MEIQSYREIPVSSVSITKLQIRSSFDKKKMRELIKSVREEGVMQGILVRPYRKNRFELIFGSRRLRAARKAKKRTILAIITNNLSDRDAILMELNENLHRQDLDPFEEARAILRLIKVFHMGIQEVAGKIGKNGHFIKRRLKLLKMPKDVQELVARKKLPVGHVDMLAALPVSSQQEVAIEASRHKFTRRDLQVHIQDALETLPRIKKEVADWNPEKIQLRIKDFTRFLKAIKPIILEMGPVDILNIRVILEKLSKESAAIAEEFKKFIVIT